MVQAKRVFWSAKECKSGAKTIRESSFSEILPAAAQTDDNDKSFIICNFIKAAGAKNRNEGAGCCFFQPAQSASPAPPETLRRTGPTGTLSAAMGNTRADFEPASRGAP